MSEAKTVVWLLEIGHRHGTDTSVHLTEDTARSALFGFVGQFWNEVAGSPYVDCDNETRVAGDTVPGDENEAIATYFAAHPDEWFDIAKKEAS